MKSKHIAFLNLILITFFSTSVFANTHFLEHSEEEVISNWDEKYGDRKNELVFIGQDMDEELITRELNKCLASQNEIKTQKWKNGYKDDWPVQRVYPLD